MRNLLLLLLICPVILIGQIPAKLHNTYVHDYAHVLTAGQVENLNRTIKSIDTANKIKFAIILVNELPENYAIEDYAREIGIKWEVGKGIIYVAAINQRKQRLEISSHLEGVIPDITAKHITDNIKPYFKSKDYYGGISGMIGEINELIKKEAKPQAVEKKSGKSIAVFIWLIVGVLAMILFTIIYRERRRQKKFKQRLAEEKERLDAIQAERNQKIFDRNPVSIRSTNKAYTPPSRTRSNDNNYTPPIIPYTPPSSNNDDSYRSSSNDNNNNNYDSGGGSTDSYSGGGSTNDW